MQALTHSSFANERAGDGKDPGGDNERLEFLGDAVIGLAVAEGLMLRFPEANEGLLSRYRSELVSRRTLADLAWEIGMNNWVLLGKGERQTGGAQKRSILSGVFESVIGAFFLDAGLPVVSAYLNEVYKPWFNAFARGESEKPLNDRKTYLQERTQKEFRETPVYEVVDSWGLEHDKCFKVSIRVGGKVVAHGEGKSKKEAEQSAAESALEVLGL